MLPLLASEADRTPSRGMETNTLLMPDLLRGLDARRRQKGRNGKFIPAQEPRRRTSSTPSQAPKMVRHVCKRLRDKRGEQECAPAK